MASTSIETHRRDTRLVRRVLGAALATCGAALLLNPAGASAAPSPVSVTQTPYAQQGKCAPALTALSNTIDGDAQNFIVRVTASAPLCDPINAVAAVYAMPGNGIAWPQVLVDSKRFTLQAAGVTEIRFTKGCAPQQFDVLTGATPQVIAPNGEFHGPLLFPFDTNTALQWWGSTCAQTTTTSPVETTTTRPGTTTTTSVTSTTVETNTTLVPSTTTTTSPANVLDATTVKPSVAPTTAKVAVLGASETAPGALAFTGTTISGAAAMGGALLLAGLGLLVASRRRQQD